MFIVEVNFLNTQASSDCLCRAKWIRVRNSLKFSVSCGWVPFRKFGRSLSKRSLREGVRVLLKVFVFFWLRGQIRACVLKSGGIRPQRHFLGYGCDIQNIRMLWIPGHVGIFWSIVNSACLV